MLHWKQQFSPTFQVINNLLDGRNAVLLKRSIYQVIFQCPLNRVQGKVDCQGQSKWKCEETLSDDYCGWERISQFMSSKHFLVGFAMFDLACHVANLAYHVYYIYSNRF